MVKIYQQTATTSPKYTNIELVGLSKDLTLTDADQIIIDGKVYNIVDPVPTRKYLQVFLKNE